MGRDDSQICRDPVTTLHLHQISNHHVLSIDVLLLTVTDNQGLLREWTQLLFKNRQDHLTHTQKLNLQGAPEGPGS